jgi:hypothetical protein
MSSQNSVLSTINGLHIQQTSGSGNQKIDIYSSNTTNICASGNNITQSDCDKIKINNIIGNPCNDTLANPILKTLNNSTKKYCDAQISLL